jgi:hypothetical protein
MDKKFLKENNLLDAHNKFQRLVLNEWSYVPTTLEEDGEDEQMPQQGGNEDDMFGDEAQGGGNDDMIGGNQGGGDPMQGGQNQGGEMPQGDVGDENKPMDFNAEPDFGDDTPDDAEQPGDEVIDVDELTRSQEETQKKVEDIEKIVKNLGTVDNKILNLNSVLTKIEHMIDKNNSDIQSLKQDLSQRLPNQDQKMEARKQISGPFYTNPEDFWREKGANNATYDVYNQKQPQKQEYVLRQSDIQNPNPSTIANSFYTADDEELSNQDLERIFGY